jgi:hypothetical protein
VLDADRARVHQTCIETSGTVLMRPVRPLQTAAAALPIPRCLERAALRVRQPSNQCPPCPYCLQRSALAAWAVLALVCSAAAAAAGPPPLPAAAAAALEAGAEAGELPSLAEQQYWRALEIRWVRVNGRTAAWTQQPLLVCLFPSTAGCCRLEPRLTTPLPTTNLPLSLASAAAGTCRTPRSGS